MVGRKPLIEPSKVVAAIMKFKDRVVMNDNGENYSIVVATNPVWYEISCYLNGCMSGAALHTFVYRDAHGIKAKLGFVFNQNDKKNNLMTEENNPHKDDDSSEENSDTPIKLPSKKIIFTFSPEEWQSLEPVEVRYKSNDKNHLTQGSKIYHVLPKNKWTPLLAEHFWEHTQLPCCLSFRRAKVHPYGNFYIKVVGKCTTCDSYFEGIVYKRPPPTARVLMECSYTGNFNEVHKVKKRRMIGSAQSKAITSMINDGRSSESFRELEAVRLIKIGANNPPIIPTANALRLLKSRKNASEKRNKDALTAIALMKRENEYKDIIRNVGCDPFFIYYYNPEQIHLYREYCRSVTHPQIIIDATGSVVKNFMKFGQEQTKKLFLYEAVVYDKEKNHSFTVSNMISESHDTIAIFNWLANWMTNNIPHPKQTVCDQSLALLSAIVKTFTQYSSLKMYLEVCADMITNRLPRDSRWLPHCYVKLDIAHFMKLASQWPSLKLLNRKVREIILRTIGRLVICKDIEEVYSLLLSIFISITNESNGLKRNIKVETSCQKHIKRLMEIVSTGIIELDQQLDKLINDSGAGSNTYTKIEEQFYDNQYEGLDEHNPFQKWAEKVYIESKQHIQEGTDINPLYAPEIVPHLIKIMKLLPLWSGIMIPIFGFGDVITSSAAVESSFNKLKNTTFKHISLPTDIESFLETHLISLRGSSLIKSTTVLATEIINEVETEDHEMQNESYNLNMSNCPLCKFGSFPSKNGAHKCSICKIPVHALSECSTHLPNQDDIRLCYNCLEMNEKSKENNAIDKWCRRSKKQLKSSSYIVPNPHLRHVNLGNSQNSRHLPLLKNGSRADELKSCALKSQNANLILSNTCAFDSIASMIMVSFCDSQNYSSGLLKIKTKFVDFISKLVKNGITSHTYSERAELIITSLNPNRETLEYNMALVICDTTPKSVFKLLLSEFPTIKETSKCSNETCEKFQEISEDLCFVTYTTTSEKVDDLQEFINNRTKTEEFICNHPTNENQPCNFLRKTSYKVSPLHVLIEILYWKGENMQQSSEAAPHITIKLCDIPKVIIYNEASYKLRGVLNYRPGKSFLRSSIGHYTTYARRCGGNWELYDDLKKKPLSIAENTMASCEILIYSI